MISLDLGCGQFKREGYLGIDKRTKNPLNNKPTKADLIWDLDDGIPFKDNVVDEIYTSHFLEHITDIDLMLYEMWRVCRAGSFIEIIVPVEEVLSGDHNHKFCY